MKMNLGCGRNILEGWTNVDSVWGPGVDIVADLNQPVNLGDNDVSHFLMSHVLEHITRPLTLMESCWNAATPDAIMTVRCPYGSSDDADEDPTHVRRMFLQSTGYFSQPFYWRADYGYRGDWRTDQIMLFVSPDYVGVPDATVMHDVKIYRNVVREIVYEMTAVKPRRSSERALQVAPEIVIAAW